MPDPHHLSVTPSLFHCLLGLAWWFVCLFACLWVGLGFGLGWLVCGFLGRWSVGLSAGWLGCWKHFELYTGSQGRNLRLPIWPSLQRRQSSCQIGSKTKGPGLGCWSCGFKAGNPSVEALEHHVKPFIVTRFNLNSGWPGFGPGHCMSLGFASCGSNAGAFCLVDVYFGGPLMSFNHRQWMGWSMSCLQVTVYNRFLLGGQVYIFNFR